jgi:hypothetical protein
VKGEEIVILLAEGVPIGIKEHEHRTSEET